MTTNPIPKRRILLVDDDMLTLTTIGQVLRQAGYETAEASSGAEALQVELEFSPDLAILDVVMEGMSGIELAQHLQAATATPFMFISARGEAEIVAGRETSMAVGMLMAKFHTDRDSAFDALRSYSRSNRRKVNDVAATLLDAEDMSNAFRSLLRGKSGA